MSNFYLIFDTNDGRPICYQSTSDNIDESILRNQVKADNPAHDVLPVTEAEAPTAYAEYDANEDTWSVQQKTPLLATWDKATIIPDGIDEMVLSTLPIPCTVAIDGLPYLVEDGSLEFTADAVGIYRIVVSHPAHIKEEWSIDVN